MNQIAIIIPIYNAEKTIQSTLASLNLISAASAGYCHIVLVDDGSTDRSISIAAKNMKALRPIKSTVLRQDNQGAGSARNKAIRHCRSNWIMFLDADDELAFNPLPYLNAHPDVSALAFATKRHKAAKRIWTSFPQKISPANHLDIFTASNPFPISALIFKKEMIDQYFDPDLLWAEDWFFWLMNPRIFSQCECFRHQVSAVTHIHEDNKSGNISQHGRFRYMAADKALRELNNNLTAKQRNNLLMQKDAALIQQKLDPSPGAFRRIPCDLKLYCKLILYASGIAGLIQPFRNKAD